MHLVEIPGLQIFLRDCPLWTNLATQTTRVAIGIDFLDGRFAVRPFTLDVRKVRGVQHSSGTSRCPSLEISRHSRAMADSYSGLKKAKHLFEFITQVSIKVLSAGLRPSSAMAPTKQHQFSTSC